MKEKEVGEAIVSPSANEGTSAKEYAASSFNDKVTDLVRDAASLSSKGFALVGVLVDRIVCHMGTFQLFSRESETS